MTLKVEMPFNKARQIADKLLKELTALGAKRVEICGSILREEATVGDIDILVDGDIDSLARKTGDYKSGGDSMVTMVYMGQQVNLFKGWEGNWGAMLHYLTGPKTTSLPTG